MIAFGLYYFFYVRRQIAYFEARNLRLVSTLASQLKNSVETHRGITERDAKPETGPDEVPAKEKPILAALSIRPIKTVFGPVCRQTFLREFEDVVIANRTGHVLYSCNDTSPMASLDKVPLRESWKDDKVLNFTSLQRTSRSTRTFFDGEIQRLFSHPLPVAAPSEDKGAPAIDTTESNWVVAGFIPEERFNGESLSISYTLLVIVLAVLILTILALPYLRLGLIGELQRVRLADVLMLCICTLLGVAVLTLVLLDSISYQLMRRVCDRQLRHLASDLKRHALDEIGKAQVVLDDLDRSFVLREKPSRPLTAQEFRTPSVQKYPHFESFYRIDREGVQVAKGSTEAKPTGLVKVNERSYFQGIKNGHFTKDNYVIESIRSLATGSTQAVISRRSSHYMDWAPDRHPMVAAVTFPMRSLIDPVIAAGYKFAVIDRDGKVLFHSDSQRNTFENFFKESDDNPALRAAAFGRQNEIINLRYWGTDHRAFVTPVEGTPWTMVTFRSKRLLRALNVETIVIAVMFLVVYAFGFGLVLATIAVLKPSYRAPWLWFDKNNVYDYRRLIYSYLLFAMSLVGSIYLFKPRPLVIVAFLAPIMAALVTYVRLRRIGGVIAKLALIALGVVYALWLMYVWFDNLGAIAKHIEPDVALNQSLVMVWVVFAGTAAILAALLPPWRKESSRADFRRHFLVPGYAYCWAATLLVAVVSVLPTAAFFKAAFKIETESFVKFGQVELIEKFARRAQLTLERKHKLQVEAAEKGDPELKARVETLIQRRDTDSLDLYHRFFFDTELVRSSQRLAVDPSGSPKVRSFTPSLIQRASTVPSDPAPVPALLERMLPHYSKESIKMRELLHSKTKQDEWKWIRRGEILEFAPKEWPGAQAVVVWSGASRVFDIPWALRPKIANEPRTILYPEKPDYQTLKPDPDDLGFTLKTGLLLFAIVTYLATIVWAVRFINKKVFLVDVTEPLWLSPKQRVGPALGGNLLIFTDSRKRALRSIDRENFITVSSRWFKDSASEKFWRTLMTGIDIQPGGSGVLIANFDAEWDDPVVRKGLLRFVEIVTNVHHRRVMIVTETSPWVLFGEIETSEAARWSAVLASYLVRIDDGHVPEEVPRAAYYGKPLGDSLDEFFAFLSFIWRYLRRANRNRTPPRAVLDGLTARINATLERVMTSAAAHIDISPFVNGSKKHTERIIDEECFASPFLVQLGKELKRQNNVRGEEQLYDEIGERAGSYYGVLWARCSTTEKVVLQHIAEDGFANVNDRQTLRRLLSRGVLTRRPHFELMNETFRRFVLTTARRAEVAALYTNTPVSTWDKIEKPLMAGLLCAAVFFVATQRELFDVTMTMVTAVATGIPTVVKLAGFFAEPRALLSPGRS